MFSNQPNPIHPRWRGLLLALALLLAYDGSASPTWSCCSPSCAG